MLWGRVCNSLIGAAPCLFHLEFNCAHEEKLHEPCEYSLFVSRCHCVPISLVCSVFICLSLNKSAPKEPHSATASWHQGGTCLANAQIERGDAPRDKGGCVCCTNYPKSQHHCASNPCRGLMTVEHVALFLRDACNYSKLNRIVLYRVVGGLHVRCASVVD